MNWSTTVIEYHNNAFVCVVTLTCLDPPDVLEVHHVHYTSH